MGTGRLAAATATGALPFADGLRAAAAGAGGAAGPVPLPPVGDAAGGPVVVLDLGPAPRAGPGATGRPRTPVVPTLVPGVPDDRALLAAVAELWCRGIPARLTPAGRGRRVRLPVRPLAWAVATA